MPLQCKSVGWLLAENKECVILVPHIAGDKCDAVLQGCGDLTIPADSITKVTVLRKG